MFLALVKRITDSDKEEAPSTASGPLTISRAASKVDVSATSLLLRGAFDVMFRQVDNFLYASHALTNDKTLCAEGTDQEIFYLSSQADQMRPSEGPRKKKGESNSPAEIRKSEMIGERSSQNKQFPDQDFLESKPFCDLPSLAKIEYDVGSHIRCLKFHWSDDTSSDKYGGFTLV